MNKRDSNGNGICIWQCMKLKYFLMLLMQPRIVLQRLHDKRDYGEPSDLNRILGSLNESTPLYSNEANLGKQVFRQLFDEQRRSTFISCYYNSQIITENMLVRFGGDSGIAVCFDKAKLLQHCQETDIKSNNVEYTGFSCYKSVDDLVNDVESHDFFFKKFQENHDENEFRVIMGCRYLYGAQSDANDESAFDDSYADSVKYIDIDFSSIMQMAIRRCDFENNVFLPKLCEKFGLLLSVKEQNESIKNPVLFYDVAIERGSYD